MAMAQMKAGLQEWPRACDLDRLVHASVRPLAQLQGMPRWNTQREIFVRLCCLRDPFLPKLSKAERRRVNAFISAALRDFLAAVAATADSVLHLARLQLVLGDSCDLDAALTVAQGKLSTSLLDCPHARAILMQKLEASSWRKRQRAQCSRGKGTGTFAC